MREVDAAICFEPAPGIFQHEICEIDSAILDAVHSLNLGELVRCGVGIFTRECAGEIETAQLDIFPI